MRKINKLLITIILIATLLLGIGYSAIQNITLDIEGTVSAKATIYSAKTLSTKAYGGYISNYVPVNGSSIGWRIFYSDGENIYLIADDYIEKTYVPKDSDGIVTIGEGNTNWQLPFSVGNSENFFAKINDDIRNKWFKKYIESGYEGTSYSFGLTEYFLDIDLWSGFKDSQGYAKYAVGTPTLELFIASYNRTHPASTIVTRVNNEYGYQVKGAGADAYSYSVSNLDDSNNLYVIKDNTKARGCWIATPSSGEKYGSGGYNLGRDFFNIRYNSMIDNEAFYTATRGSRPIIVLNSDVEIIWDGADQYIIIS